MKVLIFAMLTAVATSQPRSGDPADDPNLFFKLLESIYPGRFPESLMMMNNFVEAITMKATIMTLTKLEVNEGELIKCQREIAHWNVTSCEKLASIYEKCVRPETLRPFTQKHHENSTVISADELEIVDTRGAGFLGMIEFLCESDAKKREDLKDSCVRLQAIYLGQEGKKKFNKERLNFASAPSKSSMCQIVSSLRPSFETNLKAECKNGPAIDAYLGYFDAALKPCKI